MAYRFHLWRLIATCCEFLNQQNISRAALLVLACGVPVQAALDGFNINSDTFANKYNGNEIWDGVNFVNDWAQNGGATPASLSLNGTDLVIANDDDNGWVDHDTGSTPWEVGSGSWTIEFSAKLDDTTAANDNFVLWGTLDGQRSNITVTAAGVSSGVSSTANDLLSGVDNTDGFHTYRVAYDSDDGVGWVWRDDVQLTNSLGTVGDGNTRLIIGDCCTSIGNPVDPFELRYVRYDMSGAFSPVPDAGDVGVTITRETGQIEFSNTTASPITMLGYSILSDDGALKPGDWLSIAEHYDASNPGPDQVDPNNNWTVLTNPSVRTDLSEAELEGGDGATIASGQTIDLGPAWLQQFNEDLVLEVLLSDGTVLEGRVDFEGNNDEPFDFGDLSGPSGVPDGMLDILDWRAFQAGYGSDLSGLSAAEAYLAADLNEDGLHTLLDFRTFETAYDAVNGAGAFQNLIPEPSSMGLVLLGGLLLLASRKTRWSGKLVPATLICVIGLCGGHQAQADLTLALYDAGPEGGGPADLDPTLQGWTPDEVVLTPGPDQNVFFLQPDGATGFNALQIFDQHGNTANDNPRYDVALTDLDFTNMFAFGWEFEFRWRPVEGGTFNQWGVGPNNPWSQDRERVGFSVSLDTADNSAVVNPTNGDAVNLGPNSANSYHTVLAVGAAGSPMYELFIDGVSQGMQDLTSGTSNVANDNLTGIQSGSSGGTGRVGNYNFQRLTIDTPDLLTLTVNTTNGLATISNEFNDSLDIDSYSIVSPDNDLTPGTWSPLEDNPAYGNGIPDDGIGFEVISDTTAQLAEADLTGFATFGPNDSVSIGKIFTPGGAEGAENLVFTIGFENGAIVEANVVYVAGVSGDFNEDGEWGCLDIDRLTAEIAAQSSDLSFDMNGDGQVTLADVTDSVSGWLKVGGENNFDETGGNAFLQGDANLDGSVDVSDFNIWNTSKFSPVDAWCSGDFNASGSVDVSDFNIWNGNKFNSSDGAAVVPEPSGMLLLVGIAGVLAVLNRRSALRMRKLHAAALGVAFMLVSFSVIATTHADVFDDRIYQFGDDSFEGGAVGDILGSNVPAPFNDGRTLDGVGSGGNGDLQDLFLDLTNPDNAPVYVDTMATGRPGATAGNRLGARFDGDGDGVIGRELNSPNNTWQDLFNDNMNYPNNWTNIFSRGFQLWVRPDTAAGVDMAGIGGGLRQDIVTDTGEHGAFISANDNWGLQFDDNSIESTAPAVAGQWTHVMQRTLSGSFGGALLVDGVAVAARGTFYDPEDGDMSVGANQDLTGNYFRGDLDEMTMFVWGDNSIVAGPPAGMDWGEIDLAEDNVWIKMQLADLNVTNPADVNLDTLIDNNDVTAFAASWRNVNLVNDVPVGDWISRQNGDLNYDGIVNLSDAFILHQGLMAATGSGLDFSLLIPEPAAGSLLMWAMLAMLARREVRQDCGLST